MSNTMNRVSSLEVTYLEVLGVQEAQEVKAEEDNGPTKQTATTSVVEAVSSGKLKVAPTLKASELSTPTTCATAVLNQVITSEIAQKILLIKQTFIDKTNTELTINLKSMMTLRL